MDSLDHRWSVLEEYVLSREPEQSALWEQVVSVVREAHTDQVRNDGSPYLVHLLDVGTILAGWEVEPLILLAGMLHDSVRHGHFDSLEAVQARLGHGQITAILDVEMRLAQHDSIVHYVRDNSRLQKIFDLMVSDVRAVLIRCANRLADLRAPESFSPDQRRLLLLNSDEVYLPLLERLGVWRVRAEVEDRLFQLRSPERYAAYDRWAKRQQRERAEDIALWRSRVTDALEAYGLGADRVQVETLLRHPASVFRSHVASSPQDAKDLSKLDGRHLFVTHIIAGQVSDLYIALGAVHECGSPGYASFRDYVAQPKANGYAGLHTSVIVNSEPRQIQLYTNAMYRLARNGILLPEAYSAWCDGVVPEGWAPVERRVLENFVDSLRRRQRDRLLLLTPRGDVIEMAEGATVLDFAYEIHTDVGRQTGTAFVNGEKVPLNTPLNSGDVVEISKDLGRQWPEAEWLGWVRSSKARDAIQMQLRQRPDSKGRKLLDKELRQRGRRLDDYQPRLATLAAEMGSTPDELLISIAQGSLLAREIADRLLFLTPLQRTIVHHVEPTPETAARFPLWHEGLVLSVECCAPTAGEPIVGYRSERSIELHRAGCPNLHDSARVVGLRWKRETVECRQVDFTLRAVNRKGLIQDVTQVIRQANVDIVYLEGRRHGEMDELRFTLDVTNELELGYLLATIRRLPNVNGITVDGQEAEEAMDDLRRYLAPPQPIVSPYSPGKPVSGEGRFWGRSQETEQIETYLSGDSAASLLVRGPQRIGKTSLLHHLRDSRVLRERYRYVFMDLQSVARSGAPYVLRQLARQLSRALDGEERVAVPSSAEFSEEPLATFLNYLTELADAHRYAQKKILLALDEFGTLVDAVRSNVLDFQIFYMLRSIMQHNNLITLMICTSDDVAELLQQDGVLDLFNVTQEVRLTHLDSESAQRLIQEPLRGQLFFEPDAIAALLRVTDHHAYYLHILGANLLSMLNKERRRVVFESDILELVDRHTQMNGSEFMHLWERDDLDQRVVLMALCAVPAASAATPFDPDVVHRRLREAGMSIALERVIEALDRLTRMETLARTAQPDGRICYHVRVELFRQWFAVNHPLHRMTGVRV